jgi:Lrp/AsnC family transcriptional regulator for asnA, asnC and gidA
MDELDRRLIVELQKDPRQSNKRLAMSLGIAEATARRRIESLISSNSLILTALPDLKIFGYPMAVFIMLHVVPSKLNEIGKQLCQMPCLRFVSYSIGGTDFIARGDFTSVEAFADFMKYDLGKINGISHIETMVIYKDLKRTHNRFEISQPTKPASLESNGITISETDHHLILQLQKNARTPLKVLARSIGVSEATIHRRIKDLVGSGTIKFTAIPDEPNGAHVLHCLIGIQTELGSIQLVSESITQYSQVNYVGLVSGQNQLLVGIHASSAEELLSFMTMELIKIKGIISLGTLTFINVLKQKYTWLYQ